MGIQSTGWRSMAAAAPVVVTPRRQEKIDLFEAARLAIQVLRPPAAARFVLEQLCGFYRGELIEGRMMVWPSNELLCERTGLAERTIRYAVQRLITMGLITSKDSPNGKRFAQRSARGQIVTAYGFDLSPLLAQADGLRERLIEIREAQRERTRLFDEITIARRQAQESLRALEEQHPHIATSDLSAEIERLSALTPRRSSKAPLGELHSAWLRLEQRSLDRYYSACGGNLSRQKDTNNDTPDQSCHKGQEEVEPGATPGVTLADLIEACPDALELTGPVRNERELVNAAARYRGAFGVNVDAWEKACESIGPVLAAGLLLIVTQFQAKPARGAPPILNLGGYYRAMTRMVGDGRVNLAFEVEKLKKRRRH